jgi:hypothetical protein
MQPNSEQERRRAEALARYDAHPGIAIALLAVMALLFIIIAYQVAVDRLEGASRPHRDAARMSDQESREGLTPHTPKEWR